MKVCYLIQSYEEIPFLLYLLSRGEHDNTAKVINCGNLDLHTQLKKYQRKFRFDIVKNTLEKKNNYSTALHFYFWAALFIIRIYFLKYKLRNFKKIVFFTPFMVPLVSIFGESRLKQLYYLPLPKLIMRKILRDDGLYYAPPDTKKLGATPNVLKRSLGQHMVYHYIGRTRILALRIDFLLRILKMHTETNVCMAEYDNFVHKIYPNLTEHNTVLNSQIHVVYFEQHYCERDLVTRPEYIQLVKTISHHCAAQNLPFYVKAHPGRKLDNFYKVVPHSVLEPSIPAELIITENTICLSTSSGALAHNLGLARISLVNFMPFKDEEFRKIATLALNNKITSRVEKPLHCNDLPLCFSQLIKKEL